MARDLDIVRRYCAMTPQDEAVLRSPAAPIGDLSDEPQCIGNDEARLKLAGIADYGRFHDRDIVNRVDDSVTRVTGREARVLRRDRLTVLDETECVFHLAPKARTEETPRSPPPTQSAPVHNHMFCAADIVTITRSDLLPHVDFSIDRCLGNMRAVDQELRPFRHHRRGVGAWHDWLKAEGSAAVQASV